MTVIMFPQRDTDAAGIDGLPRAEIRAVWTPAQRFAWRHPITLIYVAVASIAIALVSNIAH